MQVEPLLMWVVSLQMQHQPWWNHLFLMEIVKRRAEM